MHKEHTEDRSCQKHISIGISFPFIRSRIQYTVVMMASSAARPPFARRDSTFTAISNTVAQITIPNHSLLLKIHRKSRTEEVAGKPFPANFPPSRKAITVSIVITKMLFRQGKMPQYIHPSLPLPIIIHTGTRHNSDTRINAM